MPCLLPAWRTHALDALGKLFSPVAPCWDLNRGTIFPGIRGEGWMSAPLSRGALRRILHNQMRRDAFDVIINLGSGKGLGFGDICNELGLKRYQTSKLAYHLRMLLESDLIRKEMVEGNILYFPTDLGREAWRISRPVDETQRRILSVLFVQWAVVYAIGVIVACASMLAATLGESTLYLFRETAVLTIARNAPAHLFIFVTLSAVALCYLSLRGMNVRSEHLDTRSKVFALASPFAFLLVPDVLIVSLLLSASLTLGFSTLPARDLFSFALLFVNAPFLVILLAKSIVEGSWGFVASEVIIVLLLLAIPAIMISRSRLLRSA